MRSQKVHQKIRTTNHDIHGLCNVARIAQITSRAQHARIVDENIDRPYIRDRAGSTVGVRYVQMSRNCTNLIRSSSCMTPFTKRIESSYPVPVSMPDDRRSATAPKPFQFQGFVRKGESGQSFGSSLGPDVPLQFGTNGFLDRDECGSRPCEAVNDGDDPSE